MKNQLDKITINFFGIGCSIINGQFDNKTWEKFRNSALLVHSRLNEAFFDKSFFKNLEIGGYNSLLDLGNNFQIFGLLDSYQSIIEIKINGRKKKKILMAELLDEYYLFPLYQKVNHSIDCSENEHGSLTIVEKEIGTIAKYKFDTVNFLLEKLQFTLNTINVRSDLKFIVLSKIEYAGKELISLKSDTLIKERFVLH